MGREIRRVPLEAAAAFVKSGWVPSIMIVPGVGLLENIKAAPHLG